MKKRWLGFIVILFLVSSCDVRFNVMGDGQQAPELRQVELGDFGFSKFHYVQGDSFGNYNTAVKLAQQGSEVVNKISRVIEIYNSLVSQKGKFFAGQTWFWENDSAILYATSENENSFFCELFTLNDSYKKRLMWGTFSLSLNGARFFVPQQNDTLLFDWAYFTNGHLFELQSNTGKTFIESHCGNYSQGFKFYFGDSAYVNLYPDAGGRIKYYAYFRDTLWHCWDDEFRNDTCAKGSR